MGYAGESRTWDLLNEFSPAEWTVFYEPYLARSGSELGARIPDFVIIVPGNGVMVMDVKGLKGDDVWVENRTIWGQYGDGEKKDLVKQLKGTQGFENVSRIQASIWCSRSDSQLGPSLAQMAIGSEPVPKGGNDGMWLSPRRMPMDQHSSHG
jgi:hypothetical protein